MSMVQLSMVPTSLQRLGESDENARGERNQTV